MTNKSNLRKLWNTGVLQQGKTYAVCPCSFVSDVFCYFVCCLWLEFSSSLLLVRQDWWWSLLSLLCPSALSLLIFLLWFIQSRRRMWVLSEFAHFVSKVWFCGAWPKSRKLLNTVFFDLKKCMPCVVWSNIWARFCLWWWEPYVRATVWWSFCGRILANFIFGVSTPQVHEQFMQAEECNEATPSQQWKLRAYYVAKQPF